MDINDKEIGEEISIQYMKNGRLKLCMGILKSKYGSHAEIADIDSGEITYIIKDTIFNIK
jgi:hypothetical protein